jgi:hypothetical protein
MLQSTLTADAVDDGIEFTYVVENSGDSAVDLTFMSGKKFDVAVTDDGEEVWRWSHGRMFTQAIEEMSLKPGEELSFSGTWDDADPGTYEATGTLAAQSETVEATTDCSL